jgi:hypothetical protein
VSEAPRLSIVVTIVDGGDALRECLESLTEQQGAPTLEVLIPYDDSVAGIPALESRFAEVRFLAMGSVPTERPAGTPGGQHELYDRRRAVGLKAARGEVVCILEDRGVPERAWAAKVDALHQRLPHAVIGGAVECGVDAPLNWAVFFCDYGRYQLPFQEGPRPYVTDVNISYKRRAIEATRPLWEKRYHETTVHWDLARRGETLWLTPELVVWQRRRGLSAGSIVRERVEWGRLFAYTRAREGGTGRRLVYAMTSPLLPLVLFVRHARMQASKRVAFGRFLRVSPFVVLFLAAWSWGELVGYVTGKP